MERREFFKNAGMAGLCTCFVARAVAEDAAPGDSQRPPQDWRLQFGRQRYAKLVSLMAANVDAPTFRKIIEEVGRTCADTGFASQFAGRLDEYLKETERRWGSKNSVDAEHHTIQVAFQPPDGDCACPLMGKGLVPPAACHCSVGSLRRAFSVVTGKPVRVDLDESVLRGDPRCRFTVHTDAS